MKEITGEQDVAPLPSSFRDPDGFVYRQDDTLFRHINASYLPTYKKLEDSGLLELLWQRGYLVNHQVIKSDDTHATIAPEEIPYISYPYEWCFSQLKAAALLTLEIQRLAIDHEMSLKDASAYNVQFVDSKPTFIDTLSFEVYKEGEPWVAYRQFCQHFLGPLSLMARTDVRTRHFLRSYIDGIPLDLASRLLPKRTYANYSLLAHIHLHAKTQIKHADDAQTGVQKTRKFSKVMMTGIIESLQKAVRRLEVKSHETEWGSYYQATNYSSEAMNAKEKIVGDLIGQHFPADQTVHDVGANTGRFSRLAATGSRHVVAHDIDDMAVEMHFREAQASESSVLPLLLDLTNPSPNLGWDQSERDGFEQRAAGSSVLALALIHHIAISNNVPLKLIAAFFAKVAKHLIIEFVPKEDSQVQRLLTTRLDVFKEYDYDHFEEAFQSHFKICDQVKIEGTTRTLYAMTNLSLE